MRQKTEAPCENGVVANTEKTLNRGVRVVTLTPCVAQQIERRFFGTFAPLFTPLLSLSAKDHAHESNTRAEKERRGEETVPFQKSRGYSAFFKRSLLVARTRDANIARFGTTHTHARALEKKRIGNWNGPQPRKDYEFSQQREEFYDASFRRRVKGE